ncbi:MAG: hypothetical protein JWN31_2163, partial [Frankiales bacterium]|nr:hypothetical protein [Frankiales bacterium]
MRLSRVLVLTAVAALLAGCNSSSKDAAGIDVPAVVTTTTAAATPAATTAPARATATATPTAAKTAAPTPTVRRTTAGPVATTARPTPRPTTAKPTPKPTPKPVVTTAPPATGTFALSISGHAFHPQSFSIPRGTTVTATNHEAGVPHNWTSNSGVWSSGTLAFGQSYSYRFMT